MECRNQNPVPYHLATPHPDRELAAPAGTARRAAQGGLTARQLEILASISRGLTDKGIARAVRFSPHTVEMHVDVQLPKSDGKYHRNHYESFGLLT